MPNDPQSYAPPLPGVAAMSGAPLYVTGEDALACTVYNAAAGVTVTITGRVLELGDVRPKPFAQTLTPATDRSASVIRFTIGDGWLLSAQVVVTAGAPATGQTFARLSLVRGVTANALEQFTLAANYVTAKMPISYPGSPVLGSTEGAGTIRMITGTTPAAGVEISEVVPTGARWELLAFRASFSASGTVATRQPAFTLDDGTTVFYSMPNVVTFAAGISGIMSVAPGTPYAAAVSSANTPMGIPIGVRMLAGYRIRTATFNMQAGDVWQNPVYLVREWIEGA